MANRLGVPQEQLFFHGATDGSVCDSLLEMHPKFAEMMSRVKPDRVVCGAFEQGHLDHDATNYLVNATFEGTVLEVPLYHTYLTRLQVLNRFSDPTGEEILALSPEEGQFKIDSARGYPSQTIWRVLLWNERWWRARLQPARLWETERMRLQTHRDFSRPNHPPRLARRVASSAAWVRWVEALQQAETDARWYP